MEYKQLAKVRLADIIRLIEEKQPNGFNTILARLKLDRSLSREQARELDDWLSQNADLQPQPQDDSMEKNAAYNRAALESAAKRLQAKQDQQAGLDRLEQYAVEQRLSRVQSNVDAIDQWLQTNCKGYWSVGGIDAAVRVLSAQGRLKFDQPPVTPPPPAPARQWKKGDPLPDDASEEQLRASTAEQVKAWLRRKR